jgi:hypothetical protein
MFIFKPDKTSSPNITRITESAERETFWITVADASRLAVDQWIKVYMRSPEAIDEFLAPRSPERRWKNLFDEGITIDEEHSIAEIQGNRIRLNEPLHAHVNPAHKWPVRVYPHLESNGSPVEPESLFEAQLALRLGKLPIWLNTLHKEWETLRKIPLLK